VRSTGAGDAGPLAPLVGVGAVVWRGTAVLLIRRGKPPRYGEWSLPGGRQEWGETVEAAVRREVREETRLEIGPLRLVDVVDLLVRDDNGALARHYTLIDYTAEVVSGVAVAGDDASAVGWFEPDALVELRLWPATRSVIARAATLRHEGAQSAPAS